MPNRIGQVAFSFCCFSEAAAEKGVSQGMLHGRVLPHWRMAPGILALSTNVLATTYFALHSSHFLVAFVPGSIASVYLIYLVWDFKNLKTLSENNTELRSSIDKFESTIGDLESTSQELKAERDSFHQENEKLKKTSEHLESQNIELNAAVVSLKKVNEDLVKQLDTHTRQLDRLVSLLKGIGESAEKDHKDFAHKLAEFTKELPNLEKARLGFAETGSAIEEKMKQQAVATENAASTLKEIFTKINDWKDQAAISEKIESLEKVLTKIADATRTLGAVESEIKALLKQKEGLEEQVGELKKANGKLNEQISGLESVKGDLLSVSQDIAEGVKVLTKGSPGNNPIEQNMQGSNNQEVAEKVNQTVKHHDFNGLG